MSVLRRQRVNRPRRKREAAPALPWRKIATFTVVLLVAVAGLAGLGILADRPVSIEIAGAGQRVTALEVQAALADFENKGFLSADLAAVRAAAEALPWVDRVRVQRVFPSRLRVTVTEQVAAARWRSRGLLNTRGELFVENSRYALPELPALAGPDGSEWRVAQRYLEAYGLLTPLGFAVRSLEMDARGAWDLALASGLQVRLGRDQSGGRLKRFAGVVAPLIQGKVETVAYVDMRYGHGFAIAWKAGRGPGGSEGSVQG